MDGTFGPTGKTSLPAPIDHAHLARYTLGSRSLELEILQLFAGQAPSTLADLKAANCAKSWHIAAHTLKGSARCVGAWVVAHAAEEAERAGHAAGQRDELLSRLTAALQDTTVYISKLHVAA